MFRLSFPTPTGTQDVINGGGYPTREMAETRLRDRIADGHAFAGEFVRFQRSYKLQSNPRDYDSD